MEIYHSFLILSNLTVIEGLKKNTVNILYKMRRYKPQRILSLKSSIRRKSNDHIHKVLIWFMGSKLFKNKSRQSSIFTDVMAKIKQRNIHISLKDVFCRFCNCTMHKPAQLLSGRLQKGCKEQAARCYSYLIQSSAMIFLSSFLLRQRESTAEILDY